MNKKISKTLAFSVIIILAILVAGISFYLWRGIKTENSPLVNLPKKNKIVACTMEAKLCPDGSYVSRTGPNCEFALCPNENNIGIANPASVFCEENGGKLEIITATDDSQSGMCKFSDGSECEEWAFQRGECKIGDSQKQVDTLQFYKEAKNFINSNDFNIKDIIYENNSAKKNNEMTLFFISKGEIINIFYDYNSKKWANQKLSIEEYNKNNSIKKFNFTNVEYPEIPITLIEFGAEGAYDKTVNDFRIIFQKNTDLKNYIITSDYEKNVGWRWNVLFFGEKSLLEQSVSFFVTPEKSEIIKKIGIIE